MGWVINATPRPLYPRERPGTRRIGGWVGPRAGLDGCGKSRPPPPRFDARTVQPVASRYTDWAIEPHWKSNGLIIFKFAEVLKKAIVFWNLSDRRAGVLGDTKTMGNQMRNRSANNFSEKFRCIISTGFGWHSGAAALNAKLFSRIAMIS